MTWTSEKARALCDRILSFSKARECEVSLRLAEEGHTRFAANDVTTAGTARTVTVQITSREGGRSGSTTTDELDESLLREAVARSEALMAAARPDPEQVEGLGPQDYPEIPAYDDATAACGPVRRRDGVKPALDRARDRGLNAAGFFETTASCSAIANKKGNFGFHRSTNAAYSTTMRTADGTGSGYAWFASPRVADIDAAALAERAAAKAEIVGAPARPAAGPIHGDPRARGRRRPADVAGLLDERPLRRRGAELPLEARRRQPARREGLRRRRDPALRPVRPPQPRQSLDRRRRTVRRPRRRLGGLPVRRTTWIENGVIKTLAVDRYWASKTKVEPVPFSGGLILEGSDKTLDALIAETERALLVTRFWYIRTVNPLNATVTGLTRDGVWLVEKGKIVHPVNNFRFNDSPVNLLKNLEATSVPVRAGGSEFSSMIVPAIRARDFLFTSKSDAV